MRNTIGLDTIKSKQLADKLNELLANYQLFYINARGFHWNITGEKFFELHIKFEEIYTDALAKVDEIAERIRTLDQTPLHSFSAFLEKSTINENIGITDGKKAVQETISGYHVLLYIERGLLKLAEDADDEGTNSLMSDYIRQQEKLIWKLSAYLTDEA